MKHPKGAPRSQECYRKVEEGSQSLDNQPEQRQQLGSRGQRSESQLFKTAHPETKEGAQHVK